MIADFSDLSLFNSKFVPLFKCSKRYVFLMGWRGSWKSTFQAQKEIIQTFEKGGCLLWVRKVKDTIKDSIFKELCGVIYKWGLEKHFTITVSPMRIINNVSGSDILFRGMDDPMKTKSISGVSRVWIEEAIELDFVDFDTIDLSVRGKDNMQITCTFNPESGEHWLNTEFWSKGETEDVALLHSTYLDNKWAWPEYSKVLDRLKANKNRYEIAALWNWGTNNEGVIFNFTDIDSVPKNAELIAYGQDFGFTNDPSACTAVWRYDGEIILDEIFYRPGLTNGEIAGLYKTHGISESDDVWADSSEPKSIEEISRYGFNIRGVVKGNDSIRYGIDTMLQYPLRITARSSNVKKEFRNYVWKTDKYGKPLGEPIDAFNHAIDGIRYVFMMRLGMTSEFDITFW